MNQKSENSTDPERQTRRSKVRDLLNFGAASAIWSRIGFLFVTLCLIKIVMLVSFHKYLFELHWRVATEPKTWPSVAAFYVFAPLIGLNLWMLARRCAVSGARSVRLANGCVVALGAVFILLTFHEGDKSHLDPVINGILDWTDVGWYLNLNFFFRPPFLAAWVLGYALAYYGLVRTGRERFVLHMTAIGATIYAVLHLQVLIESRTALIAADCLGIASLACSWKAKRSLDALWIAVLMAGAFFLLGLVWYGGRLSPFDPQFIILFWSSIVIFSGVTLLAFKGGFVEGWSWMLPFGFVSFLLLINSHYDGAINYQRLLCQGLMLPRYFFDEFCIVLALSAAAVIWRRLRPQASLWWLDALILILVGIALADLRLSQIMGVRLEWNVWSFAVGETPKMMWRMTRPYLPTVGGVFLLVGAAYAGMLVAWGRAEQGIGRRFSEWFPGGRFVLVAFILLGIAGNRLMDSDKAGGQALLRLVKTSPWLGRLRAPLMDRETFVKTATELGWGQLEAVRSDAKDQTARDLNVVLIFQESSYNKYLSLFGSKIETQPLLAKYRDRMEVFPNFFSNFASSIHARFATFAGLHPVPDFNAFTAERVPVKSIFEVLSEQGYNCSMFYSSHFDYTGFRDFLRGRRLDVMCDADTMPGQRKTEPVSWGLREEETLLAMQNQIRTYATAKQKFFLTYVPAAPHNPFDSSPPRFRKHKTEYVDDLTPRYLNELLYMDWIISSILDQLQESGLMNKTLIVITSDHGEMLGGEDESIGHGWAVTPDLANVPLIIMDPEWQSYRINYTIGSQVDLMPTILDLLRIRLPDGQLYQGASLYSPEARADRIIYANSYRQYGIIVGNRFICGDRELKGGNSGEKVFVFTNDVCRTVFPRVPSEKAPSISISTFDQFQENFLRNYSRYCEIISQKLAEK